jgi:excisionase family DNA binding protein
MMPQSKAEVPPNQSVWLSVKESAGRLKVSTDLIYDAIARRELQHVKLGHSTIRIKDEWLEEYLIAHMR